MTRSMTAFARHDSQQPWGELAWELRSVNHRYLEATVRMPEELRSLEPQVRERLGKALRRGKVEANLRYRVAEGSRSELSINLDLAKWLADVSREVGALLYNPSPVNSLELMRWPGVVEQRSGDMAPVREHTLALLDAALDTLVATREREGAQLAQLIVERLDSMQQVVATVRERLPEVIAALRVRLRKRFEDLLEQVEQERLEQELALFANKVDVDEEMDRLAAHITETRRVLKGSGAVGRRLDFLMQEMNREANTLGSKSADVETTRASVDLKVLIEQVREQVQNIE